MYIQKREILYYMCRNVELPKTNPHHIVAREDTPAKPLTCKAFFSYLLHGKERRTVCLRTSSLRAQERPRDRSSHSSVAAWDSERGKKDRHYQHRMQHCDLHDTRGRTPTSVAGCVLWRASARPSFIY